MAPTGFTSDAAITTASKPITCAFDGLADCKVENRIVSEPSFKPLADPCETEIFAKASPPSVVIVTTCGSDPATETDPPWNSANASINGSVIDGSPSALNCSTSSETAGHPAPSHETVRASTVTGPNSVSTRKNSPSYSINVPVTFWSSSFADRIISWVRPIDGVKTQTAAIAAARRSKKRIIALVFTYAPLSCL